MTTIDEFLIEWAEAERAGASAALDALLTDDFLGVGPFGFTLPKAEWVSRRDGGLVYETFDVDEVTPRIHGDAALVTLRQRVRGSYQGQPIPEVARATLGLVKDKGVDRWRLAGIHLSLIAAPPPVAG
jgi:ketosteroid isomerase-like protein